jgi:hypothetical protein
MQLSLPPKKLFFVLSSAQLDKQAKLLKYNRNIS